MTRLHAPSRWLPSLGLALLFAVSPGRAARAADDAAASRRESEASATVDSRVIAFVKEHNPELAAVLAHLERNKPDDHRTAVADLAKTVMPLIASEGRDPELHALELRLWQARTQVDMLVARLLSGATKRRADLERKLREAVAAELDAKAAHLAHRKRRSMAWYDRQIDRLHDERDELIEARIKSLLRDEPARRDAGEDLP